MDKNFFEKLKEMFKDKNKRVENLVFLLVVLIITLIIINKVMKKDEVSKEKPVDAELASSKDFDVESNDLEKKLEKILRKMDGVGEVSVLITYNEKTESAEKEVYSGENTEITTEKTVMPKIEGAIIIAKGARKY